jgi:tetratricopeptide (TPR) repeat protein/transcriptional regulator with XRE-family HTH domain
MAEPPAVTFAGLLRQLRTDAGLTQEELAGAATLSARSLSDLERGVYQTARKETARLLADALNLTGAARAGFEAAARGRGPAPDMLVGGVAAATRALPRDIASFTGREPELQQVSAAAGATGSGGVVGIYAIGGMAGVGKTAFAVHAAHQLAGRFPDGQIFLPLHGHTPGHQPVDPADALASLLQISGIAAQQIPPGLAARMGLWRDHLAGKQVLLLLDDATGHEQVWPLLPGTAGSLVLVTSRRHLSALEDAEAISLDTLPAGDAARLFIRLAARPGLDPGDRTVTEITRLCGCLPLAVAISGRQLHHHPAWTPADLAADLSGARDRLKLMKAENLSVAAAFDLSYQDLTTGQQRLFRRLGLHPGTDIDTYAAAALDDADLATARGNLDGLYDQYLLAEPARGRYRLHDLIREHARTLAAADQPAVRDAAVNRLLDYYLHTARAARRHLDRHALSKLPASTGIPPAHAPDLPTQQDALAWMEAERLNMHAAVGYAATHDRRGYAIAIPAAMNAFLRRYGHWDQALTLHNAALQAARYSNDQRAEADALDNLGVVQRLAADRPGATASLTRALELYRTLGDRAGEASSLAHLGRVQYLTDEYPAATASLTRALKLYRTLRSKHGQADALHGLGIVQRLTANFPASAASLTQALELYRVLRDLDGEAEALNSLGNLLYTTDDYPAAAAALSQALELYRTSANRNGEANSHRDLGVVQCKTGDYVAAAASQELALELYRALGNRFGEANSRYELGIVQRSTADYPASAASLNQALELYGTLGDRLGEANALTDLGVVQRLTADFPAAAEGLTRALGVYRALGDRLGEAETLNNLGELSLAVAKPAEARAWHEQALVIARDITTALEEARALEGIGRCHLHAEQFTSSAALLGEALAIYQRLGSPNAESIETTLKDHGLCGRGR